MYKILGLSGLQEKWGKSADLLVDMFTEGAVLDVWKSESNVITNLVTQSDTECL
jgi:hypothetical protein